MSFINKINHRQQTARALPGMVMALGNKGENEMERGLLLFPPALIFLLLKTKALIVDPSSANTQAEQLSNSHRQLVSTQQQAGWEVNQLSPRQALVRQHRFRIAKPYSLVKLAQNSF